jgi:hypothetical protein
MRIPYRYASPWFGYWTFLSDRSMECWNRMADEVDNRTYGSDKLVNDVLQFWSDATTGWCAALSGRGADLPRIFFLLAPDDEAVSKDLPVFPPSLPHGDPDVAYLVPVVDGDKDQINADKCTVCLYKQPPVLRVHLRLRGNCDPELTPGVYQGLIHIGDEPVAILVVRVRKAASKPDCPPPDQPEQPEKTGQAGHAVRGRRRRT